MSAQICQTEEEIRSALNKNEDKWLNNQLYCFYLDTVSSLYTLRPFLLKVRKNHIKGYCRYKRYDEISGDTITPFGPHIDLPIDTIVSIYPHYRVNYWYEFRKQYFLREVIEPPKDSLSYFRRTHFKAHIISKELSINSISINANEGWYCGLRKWKQIYKKLLFKEYYKYAKAKNHE